MYTLGEMPSQKNSFTGDRFSGDGKVIPMSEIPEENELETPGTQSTKDDRQSAEDSGEMMIKNVWSVFPRQLKCVTCGDNVDPAQLNGRFCSPGCISRSRVLEDELENTLDIGRKGMPHSHDIVEAGTSNGLIKGSSRKPESTDEVSNLSRKKLVQCKCCGVWGQRSKFRVKFCGNKCRAEYARNIKNQKHSDGGEPSEQVSDILTDFVDCAVCGIRGQQSKFFGRFCSRVCIARYASNSRVKHQATRRYSSCFYCGKKCEAKSRFCSKSCCSKHNWIVWRTKKGEDGEKKVLSTSSAIGQNSAYSAVRGSTRGRGRRNRGQGSVGQSSLLTGKHYDEEPISNIRRNSVYSAVRGSTRGRKRRSRGRSGSVGATRPCVTASDCEKDVRVKLERDGKNNMEDSYQICKSSPPRTGPIPLDQISKASPPRTEPIPLVEDSVNVNNPVHDRDHSSMTAECQERSKLECEAIRSKIELFKTKHELCKLKLSQTKLEMEQLAKKHVLEIEVLKAKKQKLNSEMEQTVAPYSPQPYSLQSWS